VTAPLERGFQDDQSRADQRCAAELLGSLVQQGQYVGEVYSQGYETAVVQIHDRFRQDVGGIPALSFLVATRLHPGQEIDFAKEDSSVILLRVLDAANLPNAAEAERIRAETAQRVSGEEGLHWDAPEVMDHSTAHLLSFAGLRCRIIGTFYLARAPEGAPAQTPLVLKFGTDLSNFYPNRGLKVYKPNGVALHRIVNYRDVTRVDPTAAAVDVGEVRYASTNRPFQGISNVRVEIVPEDLLAQRTALFSMSRIGKSNTTKVMAKSVFELRYKEPKRQRIGQIIFDYNGEYANENTQDAANKANPAAIKNLWRAHPKGVRADVVTYGTTEHPADPGRKLMLLNFYELANLQIGKEIIDNLLADATAQYVSNFRQVVFAKPVDYDSEASARTRFDRRVLVYRALLARAGFTAPSTTLPILASLFRKELLDKMADAECKSDRKADYQTAAIILRSGHPTWDQVATAMEYLNAFIHDKEAGYGAFNNWYMTKGSTSGDPWADADLLKILGMFGYSGGPRMIGKARPQHTDTTHEDYAKEIYKDLIAGRLVIVDQSSGDEEINRASANRIMDFIFRTNQRYFRAGKRPPDILVYVEEAHNILPAGRESDLQNIWVRTAKEGSKYHLGLVYVTQEVSSIQTNILKNTANWFIGHLNNTDETKELVKYYDFADFEASIRRAQDRGFIRVKTLSNLFTVPAQISVFRAEV
jgi:hypothetical protein